MITVITHCLRLCLRIKHLKLLHYYAYYALTRARICARQKNTKTKNALARAYIGIRNNRNNRNNTILSNT